MTRETKQRQKIENDVISANFEVIVIFPIYDQLSIIKKKNFDDQPVCSDTKRYKEVRKLATGQGEGYTTGYLLDYEYIKNHLRLIVIDLKLILEA